MNTTGVVILLVVIVLVVVAVAMLMSRTLEASYRDAARPFGPEYDRAVGEHGDRKAAESHLADVADRRDSLEIRELSHGEKASYTSRWQQVQADFVDSPSAAVHDADRLINDVMRDRGYPVDDFDTRAEMVAADHPEVVEHYRAAHAAGDGDPTPRRSSAARSSTTAPCSTSSWAAASPGLPTTGRPTRRRPLPRRPPSEPRTRRRPRAPAWPRTCGTTRGPTPGQAPRRRRYVNRSRCPWTGAGRCPGRSRGRQPGGPDGP